MKFYGFLSNGATAALVSPDGSVDWLPMPRFDSASVFTRLLGDDTNGFFRVGATGEATTSQRYIPGTNVLETAIETREGRALIRDYLVIGRPELRRLVTTRIPLEVVLRPSFCYGMVAASARTVQPGVVFENPMGGETLAFAISSAEDPNSGQKVEGDPVAGRWLLPPGHYDLILRYVGDGQRDAAETIDALVDEAAATALALAEEKPHRSYERNVRYWRDLKRPDHRGPYAEILERSLLVLYGLSYRTTGAIIAAPTSSLPETLGESRQWDYRFSWIRDGAYTAEALLQAGDPVGARRFLEFLLNCVDLQGKPFQAPFFHVDGTLIRGERELGWLKGFRDSRPCREGNGATLQVQLDVEGDFLWTLYRYWRMTGDSVFLRFYWDVLRVLVEWVSENWRMKDASLWEFRGQDAHYTHSKLMCWVALRYGAEMANALSESSLASAWKAEADKVREEIESQGYNERTGTYVQAFGGEALDAALLLFPLYGFVDARNPRFESTLKAISERLVKEPWVYRYEGDMLGKAAHPFVLATSWLARVHILRGEADKARSLLDGLVNAATDLGLLGEHIDIETLEPRGNFPQAFSHLGLVMTILELAHAPDTAEREAAPAG